GPVLRHQGHRAQQCHHHQSCNVADHLGSPIRGQLSQTTVMRGFRVASTLASIPAGGVAWTAPSVAGDGTASLGFSAYATGSGCTGSGQAMGTGAGSATGV